jgi:ribonucleoside-triphosphate reductase
VNYNPGEPNYDLFQLAIKTSAKRLFPNFSFLDAPLNKKYYKQGDYNTEVAYMGCRTRVMGNIYDPAREVTCGRGNLSFTSINLPRLGIEAQGDVNKFYHELDGMIDLVIRQLLHRFKVQAAKYGRNYPFLMGEHIWLDSDRICAEDKIGEILKHGTLTVGFIGLAETLKALIGQHHGESERAQKLGLAIVGHMRKRMDEESLRTKLNFSLIATPAEGLSGRFVKIDAKRYGKIPGVTDRAYYTNSFHVPVYYPISAYKKIQLEAPYHALTNGGHISYVEMDGDPLKNLKAFESIIRCMHDSGIGYGSVNHPVDRDPVCGYTGIIDNVCPKCGRTEEEHMHHVVLPRMQCH